MPVKHIKKKKDVFVEISPNRYIVKNYLRQHYLLLSELWGQTDKWNTDFWRDQGILVHDHTSVEDFHPTEIAVKKIQNLEYRSLGIILFEICLGPNV